MTDYASDIMEILSIGRLPDRTQNYFTLSEWCSKFPDLGRDAVKSMLVKAIKAGKMECKQELVTAPVTGTRMRSVYGIIPAKKANPKARRPR